MILFLRNMFLGATIGAAIGYALSRGLIRLALLWGRRSYYRSLRQIEASK
jgi:hypothetical protein